MKASPVGEKENVFPKLDTVSIWTFEIICQTMDAPSGVTFHWMFALSILFLYRLQKKSQQMIHLSPGFVMFTH